MSAMSRWSSSHTTIVECASVMLTLSRSLQNRTQIDCQHQGFALHQSQRRSRTEPRRSESSPQRPRHATTCSAKPDRCKQAPSRHAHLAGGAACAEHHARSVAVVAQPLLHLLALQLCAPSHVTPHHDQQHCTAARQLVSPETMTMVRLSPRPPARIRLRTMLGTCV